MSAVMLRLRKLAGPAASSASPSAPSSQRPAGSSTTARNASANDAAVAIPVKAVASDACDHFELRERIHCMEPASTSTGTGRRLHRFPMFQRELGVDHVHANAIGGALLIGGLPFPDVLEVTFASRRHYTLEETNELFPTALDAANDPRLPDPHLGSFNF
jgi:hypothetical protein